MAKKAAPKTPTTRQTVSGSKENAVQAVRAGGNSAPQNQGTVSNSELQNQNQNQDKDVVNLDEMTAEQKVAHFDTLSKQRDLTDDEKKLHEAAEKEVDAKKKKFKTGKLDGTFRDPEWPDREKSKFDIQQGDFIEFLMKDVVLAAAAEAGDKTFGMVGTVIYRGTSWGYHKLFDGDKSGEGKKKKDDATKLAEQETLKKAMVFDDPNEIKIKDGDDKTTVMTKKIRQFRMDMIPYNEISYHEEEISSLVDKALSKDWNPESLSADEKALLQKYGSKILPQLDRLNEIAKGQNFDPEFIEQVGETSRNIIGEHIRMVESTDVISANYAASALINSMAANPGEFAKLSDTHLEKRFKFYALQGKKVCMTEMQNIIKDRPDRTFEDFTQMLSYSGKAFEEARANMKHSLYQEKGGQPITENQQHLDSVWQKLRNRDQWSEQKDSAKETDLKTMQQEAFGQRDDYLQRQFDNVIRQQSDLQQQKQEQNKRSNETSKNTPEKEKETPKKSLGQNRGGESR